MFNKLSRYIKYKFIKIFLVIALGVVFIIFTAQFMNNLKDSLSNKSEFLQVILLSLYGIPYYFQKALPFITLFSALYLIRSVSNTNELDIIKASGVSIWKFILAAIPVIFIIGTLVVFIVSPLISVFQSNINAANNDTSNSIISVNTNNFWIADTEDNYQLIIKAKEANINNGRVILTSPIIFQIVNQQLSKRISGEFATIANKQITIKNAYIKDNSILLPYYKSSISINTKLTTKNLQNIILTPELIKIWMLPQFIKNLSRLGLNNEQYKVYFYNLLLYPFMLIAMFLLGIGLSLSRHKRIGNTRIIVTGIACGFLAYFATDIINTFGSTGIIPPLLTNISEILLLLTISLYLITSKEGL